MTLSTKYMGLSLKNPLVASSSPLTSEIDGISRLADAGVAAVVLPSLFEEQIEAEIHHYDNLATATSGMNPEADSYFPAVDECKCGPEGYLRLIEDARKSVDIPVIASLNGTSAGGWVSYAKLMEDAGASGLELNIYFLPTDLSLTGAAVEQRYVDILKAVRAAVKIPVAVKLSPYFSSIGNMAATLVKEGADALVLFNRFYQPDIDIGEMDVLTDLKLSEPNEIRLPLLWLGVLAGRVDASLAATTGVRSAAELVKYLLVGADVAMTTSALLKNGPGYVETLLSGLSDWMGEKEYGSVDEFRGLLKQSRQANPKAFERANYIKILQGYEPILLG